MHLQSPANLHGFLPLPLPTCNLQTVAKPSIYLNHCLTDHVCGRCTLCMDLDAQLGVCMYRVLEVRYGFVFHDSVAVCQHHIHVIPHSIAVPLAVHPLFKAAHIFLILCHIIMRTATFQVESMGPFEVIPGLNWYGSPRLFPRGSWQVHYILSLSGRRWHLSGLVFCRTDGVCLRSIFG